MKIARNSALFLRPPYGVGDFPDSVASGDFNGDGKADLAVANYMAGTVSVLLGNGDGTFQTAQSYPVGSDPYSVAVGAFRGDGRLDLAVADASGVSVLLGNGDGTFQPAQSYHIESQPRFVAVGDFDNDGTLDIAVANAASGTVTILRGKGDGTFQIGQSYHADYPTTMAVGDFNRDGNLDLAVANASQGTVSILLGNLRRHPNYLAGERRWHLQEGPYLRHWVCPSFSGSRRLRWQRHPRPRCLGARRGGDLAG